MHRCAVGCSDVTAQSRDVPGDVLRASLARLPLASCGAIARPAASLPLRLRWPLYARRSAHAKRAAIRRPEKQGSPRVSGSVFCLAVGLDEASVRVARPCRRSAGAGRAQRGLDLSHKHFGTWSRYAA